MDKELKKGLVEATGTTTTAVVLSVLIKFLNDKQTEPFDKAINNFEGITIILLSGSLIAIVFVSTITAFEAWQAAIQSQKKLIEEQHRLQLNTLRVIADIEKMLAE